MSLDASKVTGDFFEAGKKHICRFCHAPIQKLFSLPDGKEGLLPLGNYRMWTLELSNGTRMSVNSCKDCRDQFDASDEELCKAVLDSNVKAWAIKGEPLDKVKVKLLGSKKIKVLNMPLQKVALDEALRAGKLRE